MEKPDFNFLVNEFYQGLYRYGYSLARNPDEASDLTQQTFLLWAEKGHQLRDASKVKSWLFTTLYREFLRIRRRSSKYTNESIDDDEAPQAILAEQSKQGDQADANIALDALDQLEETFRATLLLIYIEDLAYKEIAEILDIPIGTVMSRISRGKSQLRGILQQKTESKNIEFPPQTRKSNG